MFGGYIVEKTKTISEIHLPIQEDVEEWILMKLRKTKLATGILIDQKTGKPVREYHSNTDF